MVKVSVIGATGYAGAELLSILNRHPQAQLAHITSESHTGKKISELYPHLRGICDLTLESLADIENIGKDSDLFLSPCRTVTQWTSDSSLTSCP